MLAFDVSRYSTGNKIIPDSTLAYARAHAYDLFIPGAWHGTEGYDACKASLTRARLGGFVVGTYAALSPGHGGAADIDAAHQICDSEWPFLSFVAVDVETPGLTHDDVARACERVVALNQRPCIYTSLNAWVTILGNTTDFAAFPLWNANYDGDPTDYETMYGGWTQAKLCGDQWQGTTDFGGTGADLNIFSDAWVNQWPSTNPLAELQGAWEKDMRDLTINSSLLIPNINDTALALHTLYTENRQRAWHALLSGGK